MKETLPGYQPVRRLESNLRKLGLVLTVGLGIATGIFGNATTLPLAATTLPLATAPALPATAPATAATPPQPRNSDHPALQPNPPRSAKLPGTKCRVFPANNWWHADISSLPIHPNSAAWMESSDATDHDLHPDFGPAFGEQPVPYGIPFDVVRTKKRGMSVSFDYDDESDQVRYPLTRRTKIEGGWNAAGDRHAIIVNAKNCRLYETWDTRLTTQGWTAGSGATWSLRRNALRPAGWTSADAAGLPILPGLLRWDEIQRGSVDHAIRFTVPRTAGSYLWPARHRAGSGDAETIPPMGARFRLRSDFPMAGFGAQARIILTAMKLHGMVVADNGSAWFFQGTSDPRWPDELISELKLIPAGAFEAVDTSSLRVSPNSAAAAK